MMYSDDSEFFERSEFSDPGGRSALRASSKRNPRAVEKPVAGVEKGAEVTDPAEDFIMSDKIQGKKVRGATPKPAVESFPEEEGDLGAVQMRAYDHPQMKILKPGKDTSDTIQQRPTLLLKDGSTLHGKGMAHFEIAENLGGRQLLSTHAVRIAGPNGYEFFGRPSEEQLAQIAKWHNATGEGTLAWDFHPTDTGNKTPLQVLGGSPKSSNEGTIGDLQRAIDTYYPKSKTSPPGVTQACETAMVSYALKVHHANQALYNHVTGGIR